MFFLASFKQLNITLKIQMGSIGCNRTETDWQIQDTEDGSVSWKRQSQKKKKCVAVDQIGEEGRGQVK